MVCDRASLVKSHSKNMRSGTILAIPQINLSLSRRKPNYMSARPMGLSTKQQESFGPCHAPLSRHGPPELYV